MKDMTIGKEEIKICLFVDNMILYAETPRKYTYTQNYWN
jgi:hypothetical protein